MDGNNLRKLAEFNVHQKGRKIYDIAQDIGDNFSEVLKAAEDSNSPRLATLRGVEQKALEKGVPTSTILKEIMEAAQNKTNALSKVKAIAPDLGKIKMLPGLGALALGASAMQSGDAAAAGMDYLMPGGIDDLGANENKELRDIQQQHFLNTMSPVQKQNYGQATEKAEDLNDPNGMQKKLLQQFASKGQ
jgi:hypothetical protein